MSLEVEHFIKIAGVQGEETFRGEKGWSKWEVVTLQTSLAQSSRFEDLPLSVHLLRQEQAKRRDHVLQFLAEAEMSERRIHRVEIVALRSKAIVMHLVVEQVLVSSFFSNVGVEDNPYSAVVLEVPETKAEWLFPVRGTLPKVAYHLRSLQQRLGGMQSRLGELFVGRAAKARKASNRKK